MENGMSKRRIIGVGVLAAFAICDLTPAQAQAQAPVRHQMRVIMKPMIKMTPKEYARKLLLAKGFGRNQFDHLVELWRRESNWRPLAKNRDSTAFGIAQMLTEVSIDPFVQVRHGLEYIYARYGTPSKALAHSSQFGWY